jgi:hypothetical protein
MQFNFSHHGSSRKQKRPYIAVKSFLKGFPMAINWLIYKIELSGFTFVLGFNTYFFFIYVQN